MVFTQTQQARLIEVIARELIAARDTALAAGARPAELGAEFGRRRKAVQESAR